MTPSLDEGIVAGLARARLVPILEAAERRVELHELVKCEQAFIANSLSLRTVAELDGRAIQSLSLEPLSDRLYQYN